MKENAFQSRIVRRLKQEFDGCVVLKNDANYKQGIQDILILYKDKWATLEVKRSENAPHRPNQDYYVKKMKDMSYSAFIYPENEEVIFSELRRLFNEV